MSKANPIAAMAQISHWIGVRRVPGTESVCIGENGDTAATRARRAGDKVYFTMVPFDFQLRTRTIFGGHAAERVGSLARDLGFRHALLVADPGIVQAGHAATVQRSLEAAAIAV